MTAVSYETGSHLGLAVKGKEACLPIVPSLLLILLTSLGEYVAQLEDNFALNTKENKDLDIQNGALIEENAR